MKVIKLLQKLAKIKEDQALAVARRVNAQTLETIKFQVQVNDYAKDYEKQILDSGTEGTKVAFIQDADAFREKLLASSRAMDRQIADLEVSAKKALEQAMTLKMKSQGLSKLVDKAERIEQKRKDKLEETQFEDILAARGASQTGTNNA